MTEIPKDELWTMPDPESGWFEGKRVLELGNKKNTSGLYRDWYVSNGAEYVCLDWNAQDGAIKVDFGIPIEGSWPEAIGWADIVTNFGFTEHVFTDQRRAWRNLFALASKPGCILSMVLPYPGHWDHHGVYQPTGGWLQAIMKANGFDMFMCTVNDNRNRWVHCIGGELKKEWNPEEFVFPDMKYEAVKPHVNPFGKGIYITPPARRVNKAEKACGVK